MMAPESILISTHNMSHIKRKLDFGDVQPDEAKAQKLASVLKLQTTVQPTDEGIWWF